MRLSFNTLLFRNQRDPAPMPGGRLWQAGVRQQWMGKWRSGQMDSRASTGPERLNINRKLE